MVHRDDLLDLERDVPTSQSDIEALRRVKRLAIHDPAATMQTLHDALPPQAREPRRTTSAGWADFEL